MADKIITYNGQIVTVGNQALSIQEETPDTGLKCYYVKMGIFGTCSNSSWTQPHIEGNFIVFTTNTYTMGVNASENLSQMKATLGGYSHFITADFARAYNGRAYANAVGIQGLDLSSYFFNFHPLETCGTSYIMVMNETADYFDVTQIA